MNHLQPTSINTILENQVTVPEPSLQKYQQYLANDTDPSLYTTTEKHQLSIAEYFYSLEQQDRTLYHMSITYKPFSDRVYAEKDVNNLFKEFYIKKFLPHLMGTRNYHTNRMKSIQPITYCFVDEHSHKAVKTLEVDLKTLKPYYEAIFADRLHHHAILAVHDDSLEKMNELLGDNMLVNNGFTYKIMTSNIRKCEAQTVLYASEMLRSYPDFMSFPDSFKRHHRKHIMRAIPSEVIQYENALKGR